jgi:hypothetical protein
VNPHTLMALVHATTVETIVAFCAAVAFIALYSAIAPWWRSPLGRNLVALDGSISLTLLPSVVHHTLGVSSADSAFFAWFSVVAFGLVPCVIVWRAYILLRIQFGAAGGVRPADVLVPASDGQADPAAVDAE